MTIAETLYHLQEIDESTQEKKRRLAEVEAQLGESEDLRRARTALKQAQEKLHALDKEQRQQELELKALIEKLQSEEERLYGGKVTNPKELTGLQKEVRFLRTGRADLEDKLLETMVSVEEAAKCVGERQAILEAVTANWERDQAALISEQAELKTSLDGLQRRRTELVAQTPVEALSTYDYLRRMKGLAVAEALHDMCMGCRVSLSAVDRQRVQSDELVTCSNCGRILVRLA